MHDGNPLRGIIAAITSPCCGNVHDCGIIEIRQSYDADDDYPGKSVADLNDKKVDLGLGDPDAGVCYDFKEKRVRPRPNMIRSDCWSAGFCHLKSWGFEVSMTGDE
jgi:hypothetical protein